MWIWNEATPADAHVSGGNQAGGGGPIFPCMYCGASFPHQSKLTRHILSHSLETLKYRETPHLLHPSHLPPNPLKKYQSDYTLSLPKEHATIEVIHTPGHTTDHVVITHEESGALFSGDCILGDSTAVFEDLFDYMKSLERILQLEPSVIYPAHGSIIENPIERIKYYIIHRNKREEAIYELLKTKKEHLFSDLDIVKIIYKETPTEMWPAAAYNVNHHLKKLAKEHKVVQSEKDDQTLWQFSEKQSLQLQISDHRGEEGV
uniref:Uncharacterized protein n=1 Tax=Phlebotomus papatasi TaxID=29031 RepID=A0A1B0GMW1_PHLPP